jgi:hypothetical protein
MSDFIKKLPTSEKLSQDTKNVKKLLSLLTLGGRVSFFKGIDKDIYRQISNLEKQVNELISDCEEFNNNFSQHGWIAYERMNLEVIKESNRIFNRGGLEQAEKYLISFYSNDIQEYMVYLKTNSEFLVRYELIYSAFEYHMNKKYKQSVPIFLMMIDGAVSDFMNTGFAAEKTDVEAWDSIAGHSNGLRKLKEIYTKNRTKTTTEPIFLPFRNGILHGRDLSYDNEYVSSKALGMIFAVNDWITAKKTEANRKAEFIKENQTPSWSELAERITKNEEQKKLIVEWKPRNIIIGQDIPTTGAPEEYEDGTPEKATAVFMDYWGKHNFGLMSKCLDSRFFYEKSERKRAGLCREMFGNKVFKSYIIISIEDRSAVITEIKVNVNWVLNQKNYSGNLTLGAIYCDDNDNHLVRGDKRGKWILNAWDIRELYAQ